MRLTVERDKFLDQLDHEITLLGSHVLNRNALIRNHRIVFHQLDRTTAERPATAIDHHVLWAQLRSLPLIGCQRRVDGISLVALRLHDTQTPV